MMPPVPVPAASGCYRFGQRAFAGAPSNDADAPTAAVRQTVFKRPKAEP